VTSLRGSGQVGTRVRCRCRYRAGRVRVRVMSEEKMSMADVLKMEFRLSSVVIVNTIIITTMHRMNVCAY
jgi:hypothetical protein